MSDPAKNTKTSKPEKSIRRFSMPYYYGLLSGSLLIIGGFVSNRYCPLPRSSTWSLLRFTTTVTGMYLTLTSFRRLFTSLGEPATEDTENATHTDEDVTVFSTGRNVVESTADVSCASENIAVECSSTNPILTEEIVQESNVITESIKNVEDMAKESLRDDLNSGVEIVKVIASDSNIDNSMTEDEGGNRILVEEIPEESDDKDTKTAVGASKDIEFEYPVDEDGVCKFKLGEKIQEYESHEKSTNKGTQIAIQTSKDITFETPVDKDDLGKLTLFEDTQEYESQKDRIIQDAEIAVEALKDFKFEYPVTKDDAGGSISIKNTRANEYLEMDSQEFEIEEGVTEVINFECSFPKDDFTKEKLKKATREIKNFGGPMIKNVVKENNPIKNIESLELNIKEAEIEEMLSKDIDIEDPVAKTQFEKYGIVNEMFKEETKDKIEEVIEKDITIENPIDDSSNQVENESNEIDAIKDSKIKAVVSNDVLEAYVIKDSVNESNSTQNICANDYLEIDLKGLEIKENISTDINIEDSVVKGDIAKMKLKEDVMENKILEEDIKKPKIEEVLPKDITLKNPLSEDIDKESTLDKDFEAIKNLEEESIKKSEIEEVATLAVNIGSSLAMNDKRELSLSSEIQVSESFEENINMFTTEESIADTVSEDVIEKKLSMAAVINDTIEVDIKDAKIEEVPTSDIAIEDHLVDNNKIGRNVAINVIPTTSFEEENVIRGQIYDDCSTTFADANAAIAKSGGSDFEDNKEPEVEDVMTKYISIEDTVVKYVVEDTMDVSKGENCETGIFNQTQVAENAVNTNSEDKKDTTSDNKTCKPVDITGQITDPKIQIKHEVETTEEQNLWQALPTECNPSVSLIEDSPTSDIALVPQINKPFWKSISSHEVTTPKPKSNISVFYRKSTGSKIPSQFPNTSSKPDKVSMGSEPSFPKQSATISTSVALTTPGTSQKSLYWASDICTEKHPSATGNVSEFQCPTAANTDVTSNRQDSFIDTLTKQDSKTSKHNLHLSAKQDATAPFSNLGHCSKKSSKYSDITMVLSTDTHSKDFSQSTSDVVDVSEQSFATRLQDQTSAADFLISHPLKNPRVIADSKAQLARGVLVLSNLSSDVRQDILLSIQSPSFTDSSIVCASEQTSRPLDTSIVSATCSSAVISDSSVFSIPSQSTKSSDKISASPFGQLPQNSSFPSDRLSRQTPNITDRSVASHSDRSPRSSTDKEFEHVVHSPSKVDSHFRRNSKSPIGDVGQLPRNSSFPSYGPSRQAPMSPDRTVASPSRRSQKSSTDNTLPHFTHSSTDVSYSTQNSTSTLGGCGHASETGQFQISFGRGVAPYLGNSTGISEDVFSYAADSPWASCGDIPQDEHSSKHTDKDTDHLRLGPSTDSTFVHIQHSPPDFDSHLRRNSRSPIGGSGQLQRNSSFPSYTLRKSPNRRVASNSGRSPRSSNDNALPHVAHSSTSDDSHFRRNLNSPLGGVGHFRRATPSGVASQSEHSRMSSGRGVAPHLGNSTGILKDDVFSHAADSPWASCENIPQAKQSPKQSNKDVFSLARHSPWSSCGDVSTHARRSRRKRNDDVFVHSAHSPWVSGRGTTSHAGHSRMPSGGRSRRRTAGDSVSVSDHFRSSSVGLIPPARQSTSPFDITSPTRHSSTSPVVASPKRQFTNPSIDVTSPAMPTTTTLSIASSAGHIIDASVDVTPSPERPPSTSRCSSPLMSDDSS